MTLTTGHIWAREPELRLQELLNEFLKQFFNGQPHTSPLGDATFDLCDLMFNLSDLPSPQKNPQIHTVFTDWKARECAWVSGNLQTWATTLANPASGVSYGLTTGQCVEESVSGKSARLLPGINIQWTTVAGAFVEQVLALDGTTWNTTRTFPTGTTSLQWIRQDRAYVEQANVAGTWTTIRTINQADAIWDGTKSLITVDVELSHFCRVIYFGNDLRRSDFQAQRVASNLKELLDDNQRRQELNQRGIRFLKYKSGPRPLATQGYATRLLVYCATLRYFLPKEGQ